MRYLSVILIFVFAVLATSCTSAPLQPELSYQDKALTVDGEFYFDDMTVPLLIELSAAEYDANGRMLSRNALITVGEGSVLAGVSFEVAGGKLYVSSGDLRIPIEDGEAGERITDILSLFSVREECYHSVEDDGELRNVIYREGENTVTVTLSSDGMPTKISASAGGHLLSADIKSITVK